MSVNTSETNDTTESSAFRFPEITLPPQNRKITTFMELVAYVNRGPSELHAAFKTTYILTNNLESSQSVLEFFDKWANSVHSIYFYIIKEFPEEFYTELFTILNIEANMMGCAFLASLYPCFRENHLKNFDMPIPEETIVHDFMKIVRSRSLFRGGNPFLLA